MTTYTPTIRHIGTDKKLHTAVTSARQWRLDRAPRAARPRRQLGVDRTRIGATTWGAGSIFGNVDIAGASRHVYVLVERDHERVRDAYANPITGNFSFTGLLVGEKYTVILDSENGLDAPKIWTGVVPT